MRSASITEVTRWAIMILVTFGIRESAARMRPSVAVSTALVESSKISTLGRLSSVRAMQRRCFCPPETLTPP